MPTRSAVRAYRGMLAKSALHYLAKSALRPLFKDRSLRTKSNAPATLYRLAAMIRVKNESRFLPELIAYHMLLGFEHFYIYDNNSDDEPSAVLRPFIEAGLVTVLEWSPVPAAPSCYVHFFAQYADNCKWVAFIDADEFLVERQDGLLLDTLQRFEVAEVPALAINWRFFGSSQHCSLPPGLILDNFKMADRELNIHVKVIVQPRLTRGYFNPHNFCYAGFGCAQTVRGKRVLGSYALESSSSSPLEIHHYFYRSRENYVAKLSHGFADAAGYKNLARRESRIESEFVSHNEVEVAWFASRFSSRVSSMLKTFGYGLPYINLPSQEFERKAIQSLDAENNG